MLSIHHTLECKNICCFVVVVSAVFLFVFYRYVEQGNSFGSFSMLTEFSLCAGIKKGEKKNSSCIESLMNKRGRFVAIHHETFNKAEPSAFPYPWMLLLHIFLSLKCFFTFSPFPFPYEIKTVALSLSLCWYAKSKNRFLP